MKIKKKTNENECHAMRCKEPSGFAVSGGLWFCARHKEEYWKQNGADLSPKPVIDISSTDNYTAPPVKDAGPEGLVRAATKDAAEALAELRNFKVTDAEDLSFAAQVIAEAKGQYKALDAMEKEITKPMNAALNKARDLFRAPKKGFTDVEAVLKAAVGAYHLAEQERNDQALRLAADSHASGDTAARDTALATLHAPAKVQGLGVRVRFDYVIEDAALLPREFLAPNHVLLKEAAAHATRGEAPVIPGVKFVPVTVVSSRSNEVGGA